jgi:hypothetical protein
MGEMANREREARTNLEETRFYVIFIVRYRPVTTGKQSRLGIHCSSACQRGKFGGKAGWKGPAPHGVASKAVKVSISKQSPCLSLWAAAFKVGYPWPKGAGRQEHEVVLGDYLGNSGYWNTILWALCMNRGLGIARAQNHSTFLIKCQPARQLAGQDLELPASPREAAIVPHQYLDSNMLI